MIIGNSGNVGIAVLHVEGTVATCSLEKRFKIISLSEINSFGERISLSDSSSSLWNN